MKTFKHPLLAILLTITALLLYSESYCQKKFFFNYKVSKKIMKYSKIADYPDFNRIEFTYEREPSGHNYKYYLYANAYDNSNNRLNPSPIKLTLKGPPQEMLDLTPYFSDIKILLTKSVIVRLGIPIDNKTTLTAIQTTPPNAPYECISYRLYNPGRNLAPISEILNPAPPF